MSSRLKLLSNFVLTLFGSLSISFLVWSFFFFPLASILIHSLFPYFDPFFWDYSFKLISLPLQIWPCRTLASVVLIHISFVFSFSLLYSQHILVTINQYPCVAPRCYIRSDQAVLYFKFHILDFIRSLAISSLLFLALVFEVLDMLKAL